MSATLHYIDDEFIRKNITLDLVEFNEPHTGLNIGKKFDQIWIG